MKKCLACACAFNSASWRCPACLWQPAQIDGRPAFAAELAFENTGFSSDYFAQLAKLERGNFWFESRNELLSWALGKYFPGMKSLLEVGCGTGFVLAGLSKKFPDVRWTGSEIFREGLAFAATRIQDAELLQMDARKIPFLAEFDVIGAFDVLEHIEEDEQVLNQMHTAVKPGGGIILTVPQHRWLWSGVDDYSCHKRRYTRSELVQKVCRAGFRILWSTSFMTLLLPALVLSRLRHKRYTEQFDPEEEYRTSANVNGILTAVLSLERRILQHGISMPAGGSLLLIARREQG